MDFDLTYWHYGIAAAVAAVLVAVYYFRMKALTKHREGEMNDDGGGFWSGLFLSDGKLFGDKLLEERIDEHFKIACKKTGMSLEDLKDAELLLAYLRRKGLDMPAGAVKTLSAIRSFLPHIKEDASLEKDKEAKVAKYITDLREAIADLSHAAGGVTAESLRATDPTFGIETWGVLWGYRKRSTAERISVWLSRLSLVVLAAIIYLETEDALITYWFPLDGAADTPVAESVVQRHINDTPLWVISPFLHGLLGACLFLLWTSNKHLADRTFLPVHREVFTSRLIQGTIAGGVVLLLMAQIETEGDGGEMIQISTSALALLAGFRVDLLYQFIERITNALFNRADISSLARRGQAVGRVPPSERQTTSTNLDVAELVNLHNQTTDAEAKKQILGLIAAIQKRIEKE